jgi:hypothetical protein
VEDVRVSGTILSDQIRLMRDLHGEELVARAIATLQPKLREEVEGILPGRWLTIDAARELKNAVARELGEDPIELQKRIVRQAIERTLNTFWRFFMRQFSDEALTKRTPILYSRTFDRGSLELVRVGDGEADLELEGWPRIPEYDLVGLMSGIETVLTLAGRVGVHVTSSRRGSVVTITAKWTRR